MVSAGAAGEYPFLDLMWTMLMFFGWVVWFWLLPVILGEVIRRPDIPGWGKAAWTVFVIVLPCTGVLVHLGTQGRHRGELRHAEYRSRHKQFEDHVPQESAADRITKAERKALAS